MHAQAVTHAGTNTTEREEIHSPFLCLQETSKESATLSQHLTRRHALVPSSLASEFIPLGEIRLQFVFFILKYLFGRQTSVFCQHTLIDFVFAFYR